MTLHESIDLFLLSLTGVLSKNTVTWYKDTLILIDRELGNRDIRSITITDLRQFRSHAIDRKTKFGTNPSAWTTHSMIKAIRRLFTWFFQEGLISTNPAARLEVPPLPSETREGITDENADKMVRAARTKPRDLAILLFIRDTGCRIGGVASLRLSNMHLNDPDPDRRLMAKVREKGDQERIVPMSEIAYKAIKVWLEIRPDWINHDYCFTTYGGKPLSEEAIHEVFRRLAAETGIKDDWSPHHWRHRLARVMLGNGANLQQVSQLLGHKSITVTSKFYGRLALGQIANAYKVYYAAHQNNEDDLLS